MNQNQGQKNEHGWNGTVYILLPALLFTVAYELTAAVLSALLSWLMANGNSAWKAGLLNHQGDASAVCSAIAAAVGFLTIWKIARSEVSYTKPLDVSYAFPARGSDTSDTGDADSGRHESRQESSDIRPGSDRYKNSREADRKSAARRIRERLLSGEKRAADTAAAAAVGGILFSLFLNAALTAAGAVQADAGTAAASRQAGAVSLSLGILVYGILTPFCEETVFRGITFPRTCRAFLPASLNRSGKTDWGGAGGNDSGAAAAYRQIHRAVAAGILISSILFGLYHGNLVQGFYAFCMGVIFCLFYLLSGNLLLVTALHGAVNVVTMISSQTGFYSILVTSPAWMAAAAAGAVLCGGYVWFRLKVFSKD